MTKTKIMRYKGGSLSDRNRMFFEPDVASFFRFVLGGDSNKLHQDLRNTVLQEPGSDSNKRTRDRLLLSWWVATRTRQDLIKFEYQVWYSPTRGHFVVAEIVEADPKFKDYWPFYSEDEYGGYEEFNPRSSSGYLYSLAIDTGERFKDRAQAENRAWELDKEMK